MGALGFKRMLMECITYYSCRRHRDSHNVGGGKRRVGVVSPGSPLKAAMVLHGPRLRGLMRSGTWPAEPPPASRVGGNVTPAAASGERAPPPTWAAPPNDGAARRSATGLPTRLPLTLTPTAPRTTSPAGFVWKTEPLLAAALPPLPTLRPGVRGELRWEAGAGGVARAVGVIWPLPR